MENPEGRGGADEQKVRSTRKRRGYTSTLTVMVARGTGKVRTFELSSRILFWASLFFALYLFASVLVFNAYFEKRRIVSDQAKQLTILQEDMDSAKRALYRAEQKVSLLEAPPLGLEKGDRPERAAAASGEPATPKPEERAEDRPAEASAEASPAKLVDILDVTSRQEEGRLTVNFKVVNAQEDETPLRGYVHALAIDKSSDPPQVWTYPKVALRNGVPVNYRRGHLFVIKRFMTIEGEFYLDPGKGTPSSVRILVYDQEGKLLLEKECALKMER